MIKVIIFSDIRIYCEGLSEVLSNTGSIKVVAAESHLEGAVEKIGALNPDVVLLDMTMSGSCQIAQNIIQSIPQARIVALAAPVDKDRAIRSAEVGITGYVAREASMSELVETLKIAKKGEYCYPPKVATYIFNQFRKVSEPASQADIVPINSETLTKALTGRERQITRFISEGMPNKQIARKLSIEVSTVKNHVHNILAKLQVKNRAQVAALMQHYHTDHGSRSFDPDRNNYLPA
ncbi:MAG: response regulator transcription factor [Gammaproteobacteria bacterium]|nr:response regulator transcription factor [Gammaproteobacteria bacterium]